MKTLILLILLNDPSGSQLIQSATELPEPVCLQMQQSIWNGSSPVIGHDDMGDIPAIDAACVYELPGLE